MLLYGVIGLAALVLLLLIIVMLLAAHIKRMEDQLTLLRADVASTADRYREPAPPPPSQLGPPSPWPDGMIPSGQVWNDEVFSQSVKVIEQATAEMRRWTLLGEHLVKMHESAQPDTCLLCKQTLPSKWPSQKPADSPSGTMWKRDSVIPSPKPTTSEADFSVEYTVKKPE